MLRTPALSLLTLSLLACATPVAPGNQTNGVRAAASQAQQPVQHNSGPMQLRYQRLVYGLFQAPAPHANGVLTGQRPGWQRDLLDPIALAVAASGEPALHIVAEEPALSAKGLTVALGNEPVLMAVGSESAGETLVKRLAGGLSFNRYSGQPENIRMEDPVVNFDRPGSDDMQLQYTDQKVRLTGRTGTYQVAKEGADLVVSTPRGKLVFTQTGDNLKVSNRIESLQDLSMTRQGDSMIIDRPGHMQDLTVVQHTEAISVLGPDGKPVILLQRLPERIEVKYPFDPSRNFTIQLLPDEINVDRQPIGQDTHIKRKGNDVKIDRFLYPNDATLTLANKRLSRRHWFADRDAWFTGVTATSYSFEEGGLTIRVQPEGMQLQALALDYGIDVLF
jgi:hypothetical protein